MVWVIVGVCLAVAALAAVGYYSLGVFRAVKSLSKELGRAGRALSDATGPIQAALDRPAADPASETRSSAVDR